jgi:beta-galactosidase
MPNRASHFESGALVIDGRARLLLAGDYPYYRDRPERWAGKLAQMRAAGIDVVTFYIPWRHHRADGEPRFIFSGGAEDNRNVIGFIDEIGRAGLLGIAKPGPFIHAEVQFGGLPDEFSVAHDRALPVAISADGVPLRTTGLALPSVLAPRFLDETRDWLRHVTSQVLSDRLYPNGPLVAVQVGNEGILGEAALGLDAFDYSAPAVENFRQFLERTYRVIDSLNESHGTSWKSFGEVPPVTGWSMSSFAACLDWAAWSGHYMKHVLEEWASLLPRNCPRVVNLPPPAAARIDAWLSRVRRDCLSGVQYGFTSWGGNAMEDDRAFLSYLLAARRQRGPNLEENWGFAWSDPRSRHAISPTYHALLALAAGATGFSVYPACATDAWGPAIEVDRRQLAAGEPVEPFERPYGGDAPITATGEQGAKFETLSLLTRFLRHEGHALVKCQRRTVVGWALYAPYSFITAWAPPASERYKNLRLPQSATDALPHVVADCLARSVDFSLVDLEHSTLEALRACSCVILSGSFYMSESLQEKLADYVERAGGTLVICAESPIMDEHLHFCEVLQDRVLGHQLQGRETVRRVAELAADLPCRTLLMPEGAEPLLRSADGVHGYRVQRGAGHALYLDVPVGPGVCAWVLELLDLGQVAEPPSAFVTEYAGEEDSYLFVLSRGRAGTVRRTWNGRPLEVDLTDRGCAVVKLRRGQLSGCFVKGRNELSGHGAPPRVRYGDEEVSTDAPCDLSAVTVEGQLRVWLGSADGPVRVRARGGVSVYRDDEP